MNRDRKRVFVQKHTYRRRRIADAARLLPVLGVTLLLIPLLWEGDPAAPVRTTAVMFYLFFVWVALAGLVALISRYLSATEDPDDPDEGGR